MMWPYHLGMVAAVVIIAGMVYDSQSVLWIGLPLSFLSLLTMQQEREQSRRRELDEIRSEIQALREGR